MNSENPVVGVLLDLLEARSTRAALVILVLGVVTLLYLLRHALTTRLSASSRSRPTVQHRFNRCHQWPLIKRRMRELKYP